MARDGRKHQGSLKRKVAKRKRILFERSRHEAERISSLLDRAGDWPILEVLLSENWNGSPQANVAQAFVARRSPSGAVAMAIFLVDLGCLGVKNAITYVFPSAAEYGEFRSKFLSGHRFMAADFDLVAKILHEAVVYARSLGFEPHPDYRDARRILGDIHPETCVERVPVGGGDGKPYYIGGPYDDVPRIMAKLQARLGEEGFHYVVPMFLEGDPDGENAFEDEDDLVIVDEVDRSRDTASSR